ASQVEALGDVAGVAEDLGLTRVALRARPLLLELVGERIRVLEALDVAAGAGVTIPVPGAAHVVARLVAPHAETGDPGAVEHVHTAEPHADDDGIETLGVRSEVLGAHGSSQSSRRRAPTG